MFLYFITLHRFFNIVGLMVFVSCLAVFKRISEMVFVCFERKYRS